MSLEKYNFIEVIGRGSYGEVWLASDPANKKCVVKKISLRNATEKEKVAARLECSLLKQLIHPNIVQYRESFEVDGFIYIAMAYCEGGTLCTKIKERNGKHLSEKQITEWFIQIVMALSYMHDRNILHRDLKTENIFLAKNSVIKVGDLGIAKQLQNKNDMAVTTIGTPYYMSPELFKKKPYNFKSDVWSLGCIVYEMATLKHAFNAKNFSALSSKIIMGYVPPIPSMYTKELKTLVESMLSNKPEQRPSTNKIIRDPYIQQHIKHFLDSARNCRENSSASRAVPIIRRAKTSADDGNRRVGSSPGKNSPSRNSPVRAPNKHLLENKHPRSNNNSPDQPKENDDNSDVVCHHIRASNSRKSSFNESQTVLEKEIAKADNKNDTKKKSNQDVSHMDKKHCESSPQIYKKNSLIDIEDCGAKVNERRSARDRRREHNRNKGMRTMFFEPESNDEIGNKEDQFSENHNDDRMNVNKSPGRHRRRHSSGQDPLIVLPELKKRSDSENSIDITDGPKNEINEVYAKMNETLTVGYNEKLMAAQDSLMCKVNCYDDPSYGPKEDDDETLGRTNLNKMRYPEVRREIFKHIGWQKVYDAYRILDDMTLDHEDHLKRLLGEDDYLNYASKIFWLKMVEAA